MAFDDGDFDVFGGFFDLNGDGKTTPDEGWIACQILNDDTTSAPVKSRTPAPAQSAVPAAPAAVPDALDVYTYRRLRREHRVCICAWILIAVAGAAFMGLVLWCVLSSHDAHESASWVVTLVFLAIAGVCAVMGFSAFDERVMFHKNELAKLHARYRDACAEDARATRR